MHFRTWSIFMKAPFSYYILIKGVFPVLQSAGELSFENCVNLTTFHFYGDTKLGQKVFDNDNKLVTVFYCGKTTQVPLIERALVIFTSIWGWYAKNVKVTVPTSCNSNQFADATVTSTKINEFTANGIDYLIDGTVLTLAIKGSQLFEINKNILDSNTKCSFFSADLTVITFKGVGGFNFIDQVGFMNCNNIKEISFTNSGSVNAFVSSKEFMNSMNLINASLADNLQQLRSRAFQNTSVIEIKFTSCSSIDYYCLKIKEAKAKKHKLRFIWKRIFMFNVIKFFT